jgi:hypothetical protein
MENIFVCLRVVFGALDQYHGFKSAINGGHRGPRLNSNLEYTREKTAHEN